MSQEEIFQAMPNGEEYRVRLVRDNDAEEPYDDGQWPILRIEYRNGGVTCHSAFNKAGEPYVDTYTTITGITDNDEEFFERYLRIFHGVKHFHTYGPNQVTDSKYIAFDPETWRQDNIAEDTDLSKEKPLAEIQAWLEGDVWGWVSERRDNSSGIADKDDWEEEASCFGLYGREWAEKEAKDELDMLVQTHKKVHRQSRWGAELIRRKLGGVLMASMQTHTDDQGNAVLVASLGPVDVSILTSPDDGAMVVTIDSPTKSDSEHPTLRVHLNDETIYNSSEESIETPETEGDN